MGKSGLEPIAAELVIACVLLAAAAVISEVYGKEGA